MKKLFLLSLLFLSLCTSVTARDFTCETADGNIIKYTVIDEEARTCKTASGHTIKTSTLTLPAEVSNDGTTYTLVEIGEYSFYGTYRITEISLPSSLEKISEYAFCACSSLRKIDIPNSVTAIGNNAFEDCTNLKSIIIPSNISLIGDEAFKNCTNITEIIYETTRPISCNKSIFHDSTYKNATLYVAAGGLENAATTQPWENFFPKIDEIDPSYFSFEGINYHILDEVAKTCETKSGENTQNGPKSGNSFSGKVSLPERPKKGSQEYTLVRVSDYSFFANDNLTSIEIPNTVTSIGVSAFNGCSKLISIELPNSIISIEDNAFSSCENLTSINIPNSLSSIGKHSFNLCKRLTSIEIPNSVTSIDNYAFSYCEKLSTIELPNSITSICEGSFMECTGLTSIIIPASVTEIGPIAFYHCPNLTEIYTLISDPDKIHTDAGAFDSDTYAKAKLNVPNLSLEAYRETEPWSNFKSNIIDVQYVESIEPSETKIRIGAGKSRQLSISVLPNDSFNQSLRWQSNDESIVTVDNEGNITAINTGSTSITVSATYSDDVKINIPVKVMEHDLGDSDGNGSVAISDAVNIANFAVGLAADDFDYEASDVNDDGSITISDALATVSLVLAQSVNRDPARIIALNAQAESATDRLVIADFAAQAGRSANVAVGLDNTVGYVALQADIFVPDGLTLESISAGDRAAGHAVSYREVEPGIFRVALFDLGLHEFAADGASLFNLNFTVSDENAGDIIIDNIIASDARANEYYLASTGGHNNGLTRIDSAVTDNVTISAESGAIRVSGAEGQRVTITTTDGRTIASTTAASDSETYTVAPGLYIVRADNKVAKVMVK